MRHRKGVLYYYQILIQPEHITFIFVRGGIRSVLQLFLERCWHGMLLYLISSGIALAVV